MKGGLDGGGKMKMKMNQTDLEPGGLPPLPVGLCWRVSLLEALDSGKKTLIVHSLLLCLPPLCLHLSSPPLQGVQPLVALWK